MYSSIDTLEQKGEEKLILAESCELVIMMDEIPGYFKLTTNRICFTDLRSEISDGMFNINLLVYLDYVLDVAKFAISVTCTSVYT